MPHAEALPPPDSGFSALLRLATASVEYAGPRPKVLTIEILRAMVTADALGGDDRALAQCLTKPKRTQAKRRELRTSRPLMAFSCLGEPAEPLCSDGSFIEDVETDSDCGDSATGRAVGQSQCWIGLRR